jgi:hypothetical protein
MSKKLSAPERAIQSGAKTLHGHASDRVLRIFEAIRSYGPPHAALERASFKTTETISPASQMRISQIAVGLLSPTLWLRQDREQSCS